MDTLIIGGLLVVGVGAIVALFFILRSDDTPKAAAVPQNVSQQASESSHPNTPISVQQRPPNPGAAETEARTVPSMEASSRSDHEQEQPIKVRLNGQFHEIAHGLRTLQQQATDMEQRLGSLNQMMDNIENDSTGER